MYMQLAVRASAALPAVQTQDLFEANKELANKLHRVEEDSQFRLTELQTELDAVSTRGACALLLLSATAAKVAIVARPCVPVHCSRVIGGSCASCLHPPVGRLLQEDQ